MMEKKCRNCGLNFYITDEEIAIREKISPVFGGKKNALPEPTFCPDCRQRRRITYRNERNFYKRKSDFSGKEIVSVYAPEFKGKIYEQQEWWSDSWNPTDFGCDFDFNRPFFEQFNEFSLDVPRVSFFNPASENSTYCQHSGYNKDCYMCINTGKCEGLIHCSNYNIYDKNCVDCLAIQKCEKCYFCVNTKNSFNSMYLHECDSCADSYFLYDCHSCNNCFCCINLRHKNYCILNKQYSKEEYEQKLASLRPKTWDEFQKIFEDFKKMMKEKAFHKFVVTENCQDSTGDHIWNNKNARDSYYTFGCEDCSYNYDSGDMKNCLDVTEPWEGELDYEFHAGFHSYHCLFCHMLFECNDLIYCQYCYNSSDCFGCFGMRRAKYCIFNKQYTKEQYEELVPKIIEHMRGAVEWGEMFPEKFSPFAYNETIANDYYPMTKEEALAQGLKWRDDINKAHDGAGFVSPALISDVSDDILNKVLVCEITKRPFKIVKTELEFYRRLSLPIPRRHPDQRFKDRMALRNPRHLWERNCFNCSAPIKSTFSPDRPEKVLCEKCYLAKIY